MEPRLLIHELITIGSIPIEYSCDRNVLLILAYHNFPHCVLYIRALCAVYSRIVCCFCVRRINLRNVIFLVTSRAATTIVTVVIRINSSRV
jgi:hypothetical protein